MSNNLDKINLINRIATEASNAKSKNNKLDTDEYSIFASKLKAEGFSNADTLVNAYASNSFHYENLFAQNGRYSDNEIDNAIISNLNKDSQLAKAEANDIIKGVHDAVNYHSDWWTIALFGVLGLWGTDEDLLDKKILNGVNADNVLLVLNKDSYPDKDTNIIKDLVGDLSQGEMDTYGSHIIKSLIECAEQRGIDVSSIVKDNGDGKYTIGPNVKGLKFNASATDVEYVEKVIYALKDAIESTSNLYSPSTQNNNPEVTTNFFLKIAKMIDKKGNNNGYIDGSEVGEFKNTCANSGVNVSEMIQTIRDKSAKSKDLTNDETVLKSIFNSNTNINVIGKQQQKLEYTAAGIRQGILDGDEDLLSDSLSNVTADNVEEVLDILDKDERFMNLPIGTIYQSVPSSTGSSMAIPLISDKNDIGKKLVYKFGDDSREFTEKIVKALYEKAIAKQVYIKDIVSYKDGEFKTTPQTGGQGEDALDPRYVNEVINKLRAAINGDLE